MCREMKLNFLCIFTGPCSVGILTYTNTAIITAHLFKFLHWDVLNTCTAAILGSLNNYYTAVKIWACGSDTDMWAL